LQWSWENAAVNSPKQLPSIHHGWTDNFASETFILPQQTGDPIAALR